MLWKDRVISGVPQWCLVMQKTSLTLELSVAIVQKCQTQIK